MVNETRGDPDPEIIIAVKIDCNTNRIILCLSLDNL
jgi:hypothetical protein